MGSWQVALIDQSTAGVQLSDLQSIASALQKQLDDDFSPVWGVYATITALDRDQEIPAGTWPIKVVDALDGGAGGVHLDEQSQPYAEAVIGDELSVAISHELLEMLVDPWGNRFTPGVSIDPDAGGRTVYYLVEVGDPCEVTNYPIDGVNVSDFILPAFYDPSATSGFDLKGSLQKTFDVPDGCYISWIDPADGKWHQKKTDGTFITAMATPGANPRDDRDKVLGDADDDADRHNISAIYKRWVR